MEDPRPYLRAKKRVNVRLSFYYHLAIYLFLNLFLLIINLMTSPGYLWVIWPLMGWGIGVFLHGISALFFGRATDLKDLMIEEEMEKERLKNEGSK